MILDLYPAYQWYVGESQVQGRSYSEFYGSPLFYGFTANVGILSFIAAHSSSGQSRETGRNSKPTTLE